ncbi:MAG TPA: hypothetical protein DEB31_05220, partial [Clostridiales bacterium]|nr:hypothetical protein [Clostridiales bacterium]
MTYMVLETHLSYCVVLDEAGRFLKVANKNYVIGQIVERVTPLSPPKKKSVPLHVISAVGSVAACLALVFSLYWSNFMTPVASVYLTINPEVRMAVSKRDTVVSLGGLNKDGVVLVDGYAFRGASLVQVTDDLVERAIDMGFLSDGGMVTVSIDSPDDAWYTDTGSALRQNLNESLSGRMSVTIDVKRYAEPADSDIQWASTQSAAPAPTDS